MPNLIQREYCYTCEEETNHEVVKDTPHRRKTVCTVCGEEVGAYSFQMDPLVLAICALVVVLLVSLFAKAI